MRRHRTKFLTNFWLYTSANKKFAYSHPLNMNLICSTVLSHELTIIFSPDVSISCPLQCDNSISGFTVSYSCRLFKIFSDQSVSESKVEGGENLLVLDPSQGQRDGEHSLGCKHRQTRQLSYISGYCKVPKFSDTRKLCCKLPKI